MSCIFLSLHSAMVIINLWLSRWHADPESTLSQSPYNRWDVSKQTWAPNIIYKTAQTSLFIVLIQCSVDSQVMTWFITETISTPQGACSLWCHCCIELVILQSCECPPALSGTIVYLFRMKDGQGHEGWLCCDIAVNLDLLPTELTVPHSQSTATKHFIITSLCSCEPLLLIPGFF